MKQRTHLLIPLLAISMMAIPPCKGVVVFSDDFSEAPGTAILGKASDVGGVWTQGSANGVTVSSVNSLDTAGINVQVYNTFTSTLGAGQMLTLQFDSLAPASGTFLPGNTSWGGISLYTAHTSGGNGNEVAFVGNPSAGFWGTDNNGITGRHFGTDTNEVSHVTFTYVYSTGAWTLSTSTGYSTGGNGVANVALNGLRVGEGGAYINVDNLTVDITNAPVVSFFAQTPAPGYSGSRTNISVQATDGSSPVNTNTIVMKVDGATVTPIITKSANTTTIQYSPGLPFNPGTLHTVLVTLADTGATSYTNTWSYTTGYPSLPVTVAGPISVVYATNGANGITLFTAAGDDWLSTNYDANSSRTLYTKYTMSFQSLDGETGTGGGYGGLHFVQGGTEHLIVGNGWISTNWSYDAANTVGDLNPVTGVVLNEWHTIVVKTVYNAGTVDDVKMWLDPDFNQTEDNQPNAPVTLSKDVSFDTIRLRCGNGAAAATFSNIVVAATATDIGFATPVDPVFQGFIPAINGSAFVGNNVSVQVVPGSVAINTANIHMTLDGNPVTPTFSTSGGIITVSYQPVSAFVPGSSHTVAVDLTDNNSAPYSTDWSFTVDSYPTLPVTLAGPIDASGGGAGVTIWGSTNGWVNGNYGDTSTKTLYTRYSMVFYDLNGETGTGGGYGGLHFLNGATEHLIAGNAYNSTNWSYDEEGGAGQQDIVPIVPVVLGEWHTLVIKQVFNSNADDNVSIWFDPDFSKSEFNQPVPANTFSMNDSFDNIHLRAGDGSAFAEFTNIIVAATAPEVGFPAATPPGLLSINSNHQLSWTGDGTLQSAPAVNGPWTDFGNQNNPQVLSTTDSAQFFRLKQ